MAKHILIFTIIFLFSSNFAFEISYTHSWIQINEVKFGSISIEVEEDARSGRLGLGFSYHFLARPKAPGFIKTI